MIRIQKLLCSASLVFCVAAVPQASWAQYRANGARDHNGGFFLRLAGGAGFAQSENTDVTVSIPPVTETGRKFSGGAAELDVAIGAIVSGVSAGKEWWVGDRWGLGAAAVFGFFSVPETTSSKNWSGWNLAAMFSATFN